MYSVLSTSYPLRKYYILKVGNKTVPTTQYELCETLETSFPLVVVTLWVPSLSLDSMHYMNSMCILVYWCLLCKDLQNTSRRKWTQNKQNKPKRIQKEQLPELHPSSPQHVPRGQQQPSLGEAPGRSPQLVAVWPVWPRPRWPRLHQNGLNHIQVDHHLPCQTLMDAGMDSMDSMACGHVQLLSNSSCR